MSTRSSTSSSSRLERLWNERANAEPPQTHRSERCDSQNCGIAWQNPSPPSVKPAMWNASSSTSVAVLFRGQAWRWGCGTAPQRHLQSLCWQAYARHLVAPLDADSRLDRKAWEKAPTSATVTRFWDGERAALGLLVWHRKGGWAFDYEPGTDEDDESGFRFADHAFKPGEYVSVRDHGADELHTFVVKSVTPA